uniref:Arginine/serine-rich protein 1 n=1 Tax=Mesocestoides corti TaxID=53468 RepID=A0A5K3FLQ6_MESCO
MTSRSRHQSATSTASNLDGNLRTVFIDSECLKKENRSRRSRSSPQSPFQILDNHYQSRYDDRRRSPSRRRRRSQRRTRRFSSSSRSSSTSSRSSERSQSFDDSDVEPVQVIRINPRSGAVVTKAARMFVFDSKRYEIETVGEHRGSRRGKRGRRQSKRGSRCNSRTAFLVQLDSDYEEY